MADKPTTQPWPLGPFEQEPRDAWPPRDLDPRTQFAPWMRERMLEALAGVELGAYDRRILEWLLTWEPSTLSVIAGWVKRARRDAGLECPGCDRRGQAIRQEVNGDLVCHRCGRLVASARPVQPAQQAYVIEFRWHTQDDRGTGQAVVIGADAADAERRWREADDAEWPKYQVVEVEPLGDQVLSRYSDDA